MDWDKFWSIGAMPIGLLTCFGPAFIVWYLTERKNPVVVKIDDQKKR